MKNGYTYEINQTQFKQYYYKIHQDKNMVLRSGLFKWEEECAWEACKLCEDLNKKDNLLVNDAVVRYV
jgi:hypothetical protein